MSDFLSFTESLLAIVSDFLMTEPIIWFVGVLLMLAVAQVFMRIIK